MMCPSNEEIILLHFSPQNICIILPPPPPPNNVKGIYFGVVLGVPKTTPVFTDTPRGHSGLSIWSSSWQWFIIGNLYKATSIIKEKGGVEAKIWGIQAWASRNPPPVTSDVLESPSSKLWQRLPKKLIRDSVPRFLLGSWSRRHPLPSVYQNKIPDPWKEAGVQHTPHSLYRLGTESHVRALGTLPKSRFPDASQGPNLWACLSENSSQSCCVNALYHTAVCILAWLNI